MNFQKLIELYEKKKLIYGNEVFRYTSQLLREAKELHKKNWLESPTPHKDHEQSWRAFKGKNLEKLVVYIIKDEIERLGLKIVEGSTLERTKTKNLSKELSHVKRNLLVDYGNFGTHLPDVDLIIYNPKHLK